MDSNESIKTYCFDLDGTLCTNTNGKYNEAVPYKDRIEKVNDLYEQGHKIIIDTARGTVTKKNWLEFTDSQLKKWGVKYHKLRTGIKLEVDLHIDDKAINSERFFSKESTHD